MDGERKLTVFSFSLIAMSVTILCIVLFIALWPYRVPLGFAIFFLIMAAVVVALRGQLGEQDLRQVRYRHKEETPLDDIGEAPYWPQGVQANPHHEPRRQPQAQSQSSYHRWSDGYLRER